MFAGHFAAGLAIKSRAPRAPTWALLVGAGWLDIVHGGLVLAGIEHVRPDRAQFLGWALYDMPWTHSLAAAAAWSLAGALAFERRGRSVALAVGLAVFSHFALDLPVHEHDLALAPASPVRFGFGLWGWSAVGAWLIEGAVVAALHLSFYPAISPLRRAGRLLADRADAKAGSINRSTPERSTPPSRPRAAPRSSPTR